MGATYTGDPVAVIGNGPVGQTAALLLARWGIPVILLDARPARDPIGSKAIVQQRDVLDIWSSVGAGDQIAEEGLTWTLARTFYKEHELFCVAFDDPGRSSFPPFVNISQTRTEQFLDERIAASPLIDVRWGHEVVGVAQDDERVVVTCRTRDDAVTVHTPYVIACGGARGELRSQLGLTFPGRTFEDYFLICDIRADIPGWEQERRFYFDPEWNPGRQVLIHPCPGSVFRIDWQVPNGFDISEEERTGGIDRRIRHIIGDRDYEIVWQSIYRFHARHTDRMRVGRVLIAGDCAHLVSPFGARGLNSGVQDAENAAWKIAFVLNGWADEDLLESYHQERLAAALENIDVTSRTMDFLVPQDDQDLQRRLEVLERAITEPAVREQVDSGRLAEPFWYVDSPLTTPNSDRPFQGRPPRGQTPPVVPGVILPDVPVQQDGASRLRQLARSGFLLLISDDVDEAAVTAVARQGTDAPVAVHTLSSLDPSGLLAQALDAGPGEIRVIRPDAHVAAIVTAVDLEQLQGALRRCVARAVSASAV